MHNLRNIILICFCSGFACASSDVDPVSIDKKKIVVDFSFYYENRRVAYYAMEKMKVGDHYENIAIRFYDFISSSRYDVYGYDEYIWACDLTAFSMDMSLNYLRLNDREKAQDWLVLARRNARVLRPMLSLEKADEVSRLDKFIEKLTASWAQKRAQQKLSER